MNIKEQKQAAKKFAEFWKDKGYEKGQSQVFWYSLLSEVLGVKNPKEFIEFEDQVHIDKNTGFIDGYIPTTKVLIEQKSIDKDLRKGIRQSDGSLLNPFQQAKKYIAELPLSRHPKWVITCNFKSFLIYNMENPNGEPEEILLENLKKECYRLQFIVDKGNENIKREEEISFKAGELVGKIYDEILPLYKNPENEETLKSLNMLCVRLVFCLYAEDAGLFGKRLMFHDYLSQFEVRDLRRALIDLFKVLDTKIEDRDPYMIEELAQFPYVNGGLFADEDIEIPNLNETIKELLLTKASEDFDWSEISPTIFGAVFESTLNPETRRKGGMHYTSIENIHKVIDPLFLNDLKEELKEIKQISIIKTKKKQLLEFQDKISKLKFLDPACGSGNFLTETYLSLRKLENEIINELTGGQIGLGDESFSPIKVSISQFYGIEINDFAVTVAKTALWIAESQMMKETENILHMNLEFLPLKGYTNIVEGNALRIDWNDVIDKNECNYIMGNPPFVGARLMNESQKKDISDIFKGIKGAGNLDYVSCWYKKATDYIENTNIEVAFVSTNSITQGEQVAILWKDIIEQGLNINFAYRTFRWDSEASLKAHVHCVIIGFSFFNRKEKYIYEKNKKTQVNNINCYLIDAPIIFIGNRNSTLCDVPAINYGSFALDDGNYTINEDEYNKLVSKDKEISRFLHPFIGARELLHNEKRYCVWLKDINISEILEHKLIKEKVEKVKEWRSNSLRKNTVMLADTPTLFAEIRQPSTNYLAIPTVSSERRRYIPLMFLPPNIIASNQIYVVGNAELVHFSVLMSNVHNAWMRVVAGRLKSDYRYSSKIVYNNFIWPDMTDKQKEKLEKTAKAILDARALYANSSLADLYNETFMPPELRKAHQENDKAVMEAYGFDWHKMTESDCVAELMKMYQELVNNKKTKKI